jgi:hypothetical protein
MQSFNPAAQIKSLQRARQKKEPSGASKELNSLYLPAPVERA